MACKQIDLGNGATAIVCTRDRREPCPCGSGLPVSRLCDFELGGRKAGSTCSDKLCDRCASSPPGTDLDYCQAHARLVDGWLTIAGMAAAWGVEAREVESALLLVGVRDSKAHGHGDGAARLWSKAAQAIVKRELDARAAEASDHPGPMPKVE
ncbi:MAG: hypothetical protein KC457_30560 [Myxococcales bacterium]|nr:hypothetical protein [Myxococcales bacterium]